MREQAVVDLIVALTGRLSAVAEEFTAQARQVAGNTLAAVVQAEQTSAALAHRLLADRRQRSRYLPEQLFDEPAWNMLLALFVANEGHRPMTMKQLIAAADVPVTTAQRWVDQLHRAELIRRTTDPDDRRRVEITLSDSGIDAMTRYLDEVRSS